MTRPKIGLALGSGGARGFSHLGVIKKLEENNIPIDYISGSSMGALLGALYGAGQSIDHLYQLSKHFKRKYFLDVTVPKMGFIQGERIKEYVRIFTYGKRLEDFNIPVTIIATDLKTGEKVIIKEGDAADAVRASISIPGIFVPAEWNGRMLIDGGVLDRVPVSSVREQGADFVIAVDCAHYKPDTEVSSIYDVIMQSFDIMQDEIVKNRVTDADILLRPNVSRFSSRAFTNINEVIDEGEKETLKQMQDIKLKLKQWKGNNLK
ncbi:patatin-like phospholipase family protein [Salinibacillus xinjiangensis]|uniref:Patatin family protein n=1 Tax=Salinibacillus xinjiangensis TaxID=1229268 RepID=A0A6G1X3I7_9BACI|nr:patatin-like phospholipase family protein [Salinibacillus xinjiangensis]MRG85512.1 patatin family protein [Salinibacillus xinjiangensis]